MCLYPKLIKNRKYMANKKNGGIIPAVTDLRTLQVPVGCGKCIECVNQQSRQWQVRLLEDVKKHTNGKFVTLTFSNESIAELTEEIHKNYKLEGYELDNKIAKLALRKFLERWRKLYKKSLRHWFITELGHNGTEHLHLHGIVWTNEPQAQIQSKWKYGYIWPKNEKEWRENYVNEKTVNYLIKYVKKRDLQHKEYKPIVLTSAGIGKNYIDRPDSIKNKFNGTNTKETYTTRTGHQISMPIYWRNKIYTEEEREKLWLNRLDKNERWIRGEKIDISENEQDYFKTLEHHRKINKRLGYGDDKINWEQKKYENKLRELKIAERIAKTAVTEKKQVYEPINETENTSILNRMNNEEMEKNFEKSLEQTKEILPLQYERNNRKIT